jgi:uncharacterized protein YciI
MQFLILGYDGKDSEAGSRRTAARLAHIALGDQLVAEGKLLFGTAILDDTGVMIGSMFVGEFESRQDLDAWLRIEPYVTGKVWETIVVQPCRVGPSFVGLLREGS